MTLPELSESGTPRVSLYTTRYCGFCVAARNLLDSAGIPYIAYDLTGQQAKRREVISATGWPTVPVVLIDGELVGGFNELAALDQRGGLETLKPAAAE